MSPFKRTATQHPLDSLRAAVDGSPAPNLQPQLRRVFWGVVEPSKIRAQGAGFWLQGLRFGVWGLGYLLYI